MYVVGILTAFAAVLLAWSTYYVARRVVAFISDLEVIFGE
jgi:hypothetical protein